MIEFLILAFGTASFSLFIDMCMDLGMIFHGYYKMISRLEGKHTWLFKMLGGCIYCFSTWIYITISILVNYKEAFRPEFIGLFLVGMGVNFIFIKALEKHVV